MFVLKVGSQTDAKISNLVYRLKKPDLRAHVHDFKIDSSKVRESKQRYRSQFLKLYRTLKENVESLKRDLSSASGSHVDNFKAELADQEAASKSFKTRNTYGKRICLSVNDCPSKSAVKQGRCS